ncbi:hypothetical protein JCM33374_g1577 [Metschnikowia sp. JCM 33374]|nr:hypothetical protein JCM33374_g1577 [Metschnikowia sp. JCM 33374]
MKFSLFILASTLLTSAITLPVTLSRSAVPTTSLTAMVKKSSKTKKIDNNDTMPDTEVSESVPGTEPSHARTESVVVALNSFVRRLKTFVDDRKFDIAAFETQTEDLHKEFSVVGEMVEKVLPRREISEQFRFAKHLFRIMLESNQAMRQYSHFGIPGHRLVYKVIELWIRALMLNTSHGSLDLRIPRYLEKLARFRNSLDYLGDTFRLLTNLPMSTRLVFKEHASQVDYTLKVLASDVPIYNKRNLS